MSEGYSDLSDFGGGVDDDPSPEDSVKINLSRWFKTHDADVYWEKRPSYGHRCFSTSGTNCPDLVVKGQARTFAVEVKTGEDSASIHDGVIQTHRYWEDYVFGGEPYRIDGQTLNIDAFVLVSRYAPDGCLFYRHGTRDTVRERHILTRLDDYWDAPIHFLPDWEFSTTESMTRVLWRLANLSLKRADIDQADAGVGTILSSRLDGEQPHRLTPDDIGPFDRDPMPEPLALYKTFHETGAGGVKCQNWRWVDE